MNYRNPKLLALAKDAPYCFRCQIPNLDHIVAAHANMQSMGKGMGIKAADLVAYLCPVCHDLIDGRLSGLNRHEAQREWAFAAIHSMRYALENHPEVFNQPKRAK
jgi:hypothetical protein